VVDDDDDLRELLVDILREEGFEVRTARDGSEAMDVIALLPQHAAMLLDLSMPRVGGREVLHWLQSRPDLAHVAVCIVSGEAELLPGATLAIRKPLLIHQWVRIIEWLRERLETPAAARQPGF